MNDISSKTNYGQKLKYLFLTFLKLGAFTFGGGYAMFPLIQREFTDNKNYFTDSEMLDILAIAQSLPGMISINASILIGYRMASAPGALIAALGLSLPSLFIMSLMSFFYVRFRENPYIISALKGIRVAVIALLVQAVIKLGKQGVKGWFGWIIAIIAFMFSIFSNIHLIFIIIAGGLIGVLYLYLFDNDRNPHKKIEEND